MTEARAAILVVEDEPEIRRFLRSSLGAEGYRVVEAESGERATIDAASHKPDMAIVDLGLPDLDGLEVIRRIRAWSGMPIVVLSARVQERSKIDALDAGADDYITKPFRVSELLARVRAHLRRATAEQPELDAGDVHIDVAARRAWRAGEELELAPKEFDLLALLVREAGRVITRERIMAEVWDENWFGSTKTLDMHVSWLRRKLGEDAADPRHLVTVRGVGLRFEP